MGSSFIIENRLPLILSSIFFAMLSVILLSCSKIMEWFYYLSLSIGMVFVAMMLPIPRIFKRRQEKTKRQRRPRARYKYASRFKRRHLACHLVLRCRRRTHQRPKCLNGKYFKSPQYSRHRRFMRLKARAKQRHKRRMLHRYLTPSSTGHFSLPKLSDETMNKFCHDENRDFLQLLSTLKCFDNSDLVGNAQQVVSRQNAVRSMLESSPNQNIPASSKEMVLAWDTGASYGLTPFRSDFVDYVKCNIPVNDVTKVNTVIGIGTTLHRFVDENNQEVFLPCVSYHLPATDIRLFSPQTYHQIYGGNSTVDGDKVTMQLRGGKRIVIPIDKGCTNLPMVYNSEVSEEVKDLIGPHVRSALGGASIRQLDHFGDIITRPMHQRSPVDCDEVESEYQRFSRICGSCLGDDKNLNLNGPQKELLCWHWKLGIGMDRVQRLMRPHKTEDPQGVKSEMPPVINPKFASTPNCTIPHCAGCELANAKVRNPGVKKQKAIPEKEGALSRDKYEAGDFVSADQFIVKTPGRLPSGYGREPSHQRFHGGTIFKDAATGIIWIENQVSLGANETVMAKIKFEEWLWDISTVELKHLHSDNGVFTAEEFREDCKDKSQSQSFSGVGAQHQNAQAEGAIRTIMTMARHFLLHAYLHWTEV